MSQSQSSQETNGNDPISPIATPNSPAGGVVEEAHTTPPPASDAESASPQSGPGRLPAEPTTPADNITTTSHGPGAVLFASDNPFNALLSPGDAAPASPAASQSSASSMFSSPLKGIARLITRVNSVQYGTQ
jgi:hypothetical protein